MRPWVLFHQIHTLSLKQTFFSTSGFPKAHFASVQPGERPLLFSGLIRATDELGANIM